MEGPDIEVSAKPLLCAVAKIQNLELTDLIAEALGRPCDVAINFGVDSRLIGGAAFPEVSHSLLAAPTFGMNARRNRKLTLLRELR